MTVDEKVLWLQIPVDNIQVVEILERQNDLSCVEPRVGLARKRRKLVFILSGTVCSHFLVGHILPLCSPP